MNHVLKNLHSASLVLLATSFILLSACGQTGELRLPEKAQTADQVHEQPDVTEDITEK